MRNASTHSVIKGPATGLVTGLVVALVAALMASGCATGNRVDREMGETMDRWAAHVRWGDFDTLVDFMHPDFLEENPVEDAELERLNDFSVSRYRVRQHLEVAGERAVERVAEIHLYHHGSAQERVIQHNELWRYDEDLDRWMLHSGLPDPRG